MQFRNGQGLYVEAWDRHLFVRAPSFRCDDRHRPVRRPSVTIGAPEYADLLAVVGEGEVKELAPEQFQAIASRGNAASAQAR